MSAMSASGPAALGVRFFSNPESRNMVGSGRAAFEAHAKRTERGTLAVSWSLFGDFIKPVRTGRANCGNCNQDQLNN